MPTSMADTRRRLSLGVEKSLRSSAPLGLGCANYDLVLIRLLNFMEGVGQALAYYAGELRRRAEWPFAATDLVYATGNADRRHRRQETHG